MIGAVAVLRPVGDGVSDFQPMAFFVVLIFVSVLVLILVVVVVVMIVISQEYL